MPIATAARMSAAAGMCCRTTFTSATTVIMHISSPIIAAAKKIHIRLRHHHRVGWLRLVTAPLVIFVAAFPIITLGIWLVDILHLGPPTWLVTYQAILIGFVAGQVVHRIYAPVGNTVQIGRAHV